SRMPPTTGGAVSLRASALPRVPANRSSFPADFRVFNVVAQGRRHGAVGRNGRRADPLPCRFCTDAQDAHLPVGALELPLLPVIPRPHGPADALPPVAARPGLVAAPTAGHDVYLVRRFPAFF